MSIISSPSPLSAKHCSMCVHRSVQDLEIYHIISSQVPISYTRGILGRAIVSCPSNPHPQVWYLSAPLHHLCLLNFFPCVSIDPFKNLEIFSIISRPVPISEDGGIFGRVIVGCPSNAHHQDWCQSAPLHHLCLLNFVPRVCINPLKI